MITRKQIEKKACELFLKVSPTADPYQYLSKYSDWWENGWMKIAKEFLELQEQADYLEDELKKVEEVEKFNRIY